MAKFAADFKPTEMSAENMGKFIDQALSGELKPFLKSDPVPEKNDEPVKVIVGTTFEEIVLDHEKDVVVEFYAPWCGHCQALEPKWTELAKKLQDD